MRPQNGVVAFVLVAGLSAACGRTQGAASQGHPEAPALPVRVAPVSVEDLTYRVDALGSLEAEEIVQVTAEVEGAVATVQFHEGDSVTPETVLLTIDPDRHRLEAQRADATYKKALADEHRAQDERTRLERLAQERLVSEQDLARARQDAERLGAESAAAKAARDMALQDLRRAEVRPSRPGVIDTRTVSTGQFVRAGAVLATLVDTGRLRLRFKVAEAASLSLHEGQQIGFRVTALGDREFGARIYHVGKVADPATRQAEILGWVRNPGVLRPGFFAEVKVATGTRRRAIVVPEGAIHASERGFVAYVVEEGQARLRVVQLGLRTGTGAVEVQSGLREGDRVVIEGSDRLADGVAVRPVEAEPERASGGGEGAPQGPSPGSRSAGGRP